MTSTDTNPVDFSVAEFAAWVGTRPADGQYNFLSAGTCAVAQFGKATGRPHLVGLGDIGRYSVPLRSAVCNKWQREGWTFGALALRLEALIPKPSVWTVADTYLIDKVRIRADA